MFERWIAFGRDRNKAAIGTSVSIVCWISPRAEFDHAAPRIDYKVAEPDRYASMLAFIHAYESS
jgi:hypothetical protein